jgi:hypothetical protein
LLEKTRKNVGPHRPAPEAVYSNNVFRLSSRPLRIGALRLQLELASNSAN